LEGQNDTVASTNISGGASAKMKDGNRYNYLILFF